jgi:ribosome-binding factor A
MTRTPSKAPSQRQLRVAEEIRYALAMAMERGDIHDPVLAATPVTFTEVRVSPDLKNATAFITPLGGGDATEVLKALKRATPFLRHEVARKVTMKYVPKLSFQPDTSFDEFRHIDELLHSPEVRRDLDGKGDGDGGLITPEGAGDWDD